MEQHENNQTTQPVPDVKTKTCQSPSLKQKNTVLCKLVICKLQRLKNLKKIKMNVLILLMVVRD